MIKEEEESILEEAVGSYRKKRKMIEKKKKLKGSIEDFKKEFRSYWNDFSKWESGLVIDPENGEAMLPGTQITVQEVDAALKEGDMREPVPVKEHRKRILDRYPALTNRDLDYVFLHVGMRRMAKLQKDVLALRDKEKND